MSASYWWLLYIIAGVGVVVAIWKYWFPVAAKENELAFAVFSAHPPSQAFMAVFLWLLWPLLVAFAVLFGIFLLGMVVWIEISNFFYYLKIKRKISKMSNEELVFYKAELKKIVDRKENLENL